MKKFLGGIRYDLVFVKSHTLQPQWYKVFKVFIIAGVLLGYGFLFGPVKTLLFLATFFLLSLAIHMVYRVKTRKYTRTWLDFVVYQENNQTKMKRIGKYYYAAILASAVISVIVSQVLL